MFILQWKNKYSGDIGYVKSVSSKRKCFENTFDEKEAKQYSTASAAARMITMLTAYGEADNNDFTVIPVH